MAESFAEAGAAKVAIIARRVNMLQSVKAGIEAKYPDTKVSMHAADVVKEEQMKKAAQEIGDWDVLIMNAGYLAELAPALTSETSEWWRAFEVGLLRFEM